MCRRCRRLSFSQVHACHSEHGQRCYLLRWARHGRCGREWRGVRSSQTHTHPRPREDGALKTGPRICDAMWFRCVYSSCCTSPTNFQHSREVSTGLLLLESRIPLQKNLVAPAQTLQGHSLRKFWNGRDWSTLWQRRWECSPAETLDRLASPTSHIQNGVQWETWHAP